MFTRSQKRIPNFDFTKVLTNQIIFTNKQGLVKLLKIVNLLKTKYAKLQMKKKKKLSKRLIVLNISLLYQKGVCVVDSFTYKVRAVVVVVPQMLFFFFKFVRVKPHSLVINSTIELVTILIKLNPS